ncbi:hypothetical protein AA23498_1191 [Acetobacter nitrogenifigens DSM 23921 = NBRC 105050]|uniref:Uncharacterized protein n=1 Tax=Acetobacter nitrogenifigens DSM 23921 = NBRC 105050 TaxID=1120919 RepID=A0A511XD18_9PROT|nr:hypothetical protein [Acetobacter nitrogenifigens]GBQ91478.1 hypothetical protein AA23498_1191 [Acetobacter nitrogenifigens DSM 23921 = NBRC 105050]GEN60859.1 hypothetical protein ANI02nite_27430 [Acetobacter nitrogenifigens DSM 23921 = NBRC 105050]
MTAYQNARARLGELNTDIARVESDIAKLSDLRIESRCQQDAAQKAKDEAEDYLHCQKSILAVRQVDEMLGWDMKEAPEIAKAEAAISKAQEQIDQCDARRTEIIRRQDELQDRLTMLQHDRRSAIATVIEASPVYASLIEEAVTLEQRFIQITGELRSLHSLGVPDGLERGPFPKTWPIAAQMLGSRCGNDRSRIQVSAPIVTSEAWLTMASALSANHLAPLPGEKTPAKRGLFSGAR